MLRYHIAFHLPREVGEMVVAEALDFPGAVTQGFDLADARSMISSAMEDLAQSLLEEGKPLPLPSPDTSSDADLIELQLYNAMLAGVSLDGETYFYQNPLADEGHHRRSE